MDTPLDGSHVFASSLSSSWEAFANNPVFAPEGLPEQATTVAPHLLDLQDATFFQDERSLSILSPFSSSGAVKGDATFPPKLGGRFSRDVIRTMKRWLASHAYHPYPDVTELDWLQSQTGLNKMQISNWFANARRRGVAQGRSATPQSQNTSTTPLDIPRPGTPAVRQDHSFQTPMERWVDSPPEHEPASVGAIARAITSRTSSAQSYTHINTSPSPYGMSPASSVGTSNSSDVSGLHSSGSQSSLNLPRQPRRRHVRKQRRPQNRAMPIVAMPYQCTFCTETFRTKHDWQRHEKSLHLPLERWVCALEGPRAPATETGLSCCVFCSEPEPDDAHLEIHHYSACQQRGLTDRTFTRKDHLSQHLRLFHNVKYADWSMSQWKESMVDIRSRCGFCGLHMSTWSQRVDHLAEHFKAGKTMADWDGEWGFEPAVLKVVESAVPPYLIHFERATVVPFAASNVLSCSPLNAYELLKIELECFIEKYIDKKGCMPTSEDLQLEACRVVFASDASSDDDVFDLQLPEAYSWLRDLLMSSTRLAQQARFGPLRLCSEGRLPELNIKGQNHLFAKCPLEGQLKAFVETRELLGIETTDVTIQGEAHAIILRMERESPSPNELVAKWLVALIYASATWLSDFKMRIDTVTTPSPERQPESNDYTAILETFRVGTEPENEPVAGSSIDAPYLPVQPVYKPGVRPGTFFPGDLNFYPWFVRDLTRWVTATISPQNPNYHIPSDEEIQYQARWIIYDCDDAWNQTMADNPQWLWRFKRDTGIL